jgi:hypothetical protein
MDHVHYHHHNLQQVEPVCLELRTLANPHASYSSIQWDGHPCTTHER